MEIRIEAPETLNPAATGLCIFAGVLPFAVSVSLYQSHLAAKQLLLVAGAAAFALVFISTARALPVTPLWRPIGLFAAACAFNVWQAPRVDTAASLLAALVLFGVAAWALDERNARDRLADVITAAAALEAAYVLCQAFWAEPLYSSFVLPGKWRSFGTFGNPNWAGEFLAMALLVTLGRLASGLSGARMTALALISAGLAATFARGAWLAGAAGAAAMLVMWRGGIPRKLRVALAAVVIAGIAVTALLAVRPDMFHYLANTASLRGRLWLWYVTLHVIAAHPFGVGLGLFEVRFAEMQAQCFQTDFGRQFLSSASFPLQAHNDYLQIGAEAGLPALAAAVALAFLIVRRGRALSTDGAALGFWAAVVAMLVNALYAFPFYLPGSLALSAIFLGAAESAVARRRPVPRPRVLRLVACAVIFTGAALTWHWCWRYAASEFALQRAASAIRRHSWDQASAALDRALRNDRNRLETHYLSGQLALVRHDFDAANTAYVRATELGYRVEVFLERSAALWRAGRGEEAIAALEILLWLRPDQEEIRRRMIEMRSSISNVRRDP